MHAFQDALHVELNEQGQRLNLACELLQTGEGSVVVGDLIALIPGSDHISCEVITRHYSSASAISYEREAEEAKQLLAESTLAPAVSSRKLVWKVVDDYGMGRAEVWREG